MGGRCRCEEAMAGIVHEKRREARPKMECVGGKLRVSYFVGRCGRESPPAKRLARCLASRIYSRRRLLVPVLLSRWQTIDRLVEAPRLEWLQEPAADARVERLLFLYAIVRC